MTTYSAAFVRQIDADTLVLRLALDTKLGIEFTHPRGVRLLGIDAPEKYTEAGKAASTFVTDWLAVALSTFDPWPLLVDVVGYDKYGRVLGSVRRKSDGVALKDALLKAGFGYPIALAAHLPEGAKS